MTSIRTHGSGIAANGMTDMGVGSKYIFPTLMPIFWTSILVVLTLCSWTMTQLVSSHFQRGHTSLFSLTFMWHFLYG
jgi:hypothetical protein